VIVGADGDAWVTDGGLNAIVRVDGATDAVEVFPLPSDRANANLNTAAFDGNGRLWFTGQNGVYGVLDPTTEEMTVFDSPRGRGPYGIATAPNGEVYYASLAGSYLGAIDPETGAVTELDPPTRGAGVRRVWFDSAGDAWISEWNSGQVSRYEPDSGEWTTWRLPGESPQAYAIYVDEGDRIWVSDFGANAIVLFEPTTEEFTTLALPSAPSNVRQLLGRPGEVWGAESAADRLVVIRY
jgi:virginiamycin B lyase